MHERTDEYLEVKKREGKTMGDLLPMDFFNERFGYIVNSPIPSKVSWVKISEACILAAYSNKLDPDLYQQLLEKVYYNALQEGTPVLYYLSLLYDFGAEKYSPNGWRTPGIARPIKTSLLAAWRHAAQHAVGEVETEHAIDIPHSVCCLWQLICATHNAEVFSDDPEVCNVEG